MAEIEDLSNLKGLSELIPRHLLPSWILRKERSKDGSILPGCELCIPNFRLGCYLCILYY